MESVSCTQQVTVVQGVNQAPDIVPLVPPPAILATNASTLVTLVVSDTETANPATLAISSSSGGLVTLLPSGPDVAGNYSLTITAGSVPGTEAITNIVTDGCGATMTNTFTVIVVGPVALSISLLSPTEAQISWPVAAGALVLQYTDSLVPPITWRPDSHPMTTNGPLKSVTVDLTVRTRFYSLGSP